VVEQDLATEQGQQQGWRRPELVFVQHGALILLAGLVLVATLALLMPRLGAPREVAVVATPATLRSEAFPVWLSYAYDVSLRVDAPYLRAHFPCTGQASACCGVAPLGPVQGMLESGGRLVATLSPTPACVHVPTGDAPVWLPLGWINTHSGFGNTLALTFQRPQPDLPASHPRLKLTPGAAAAQDLFLWTVAAEVVGGAPVLIGLIWIAGGLLEPRLRRRS
jgi:hypothetical protein